MIPHEELQSLEVSQTITNAIRNYEGDARILSRAIGFYSMGLFFGWRYLYLLHGKKTVRKYEKILGIKISKEFEQISTDSSRSDALLEVHNNYKNFWKVISNCEPIASERSFIRKHSS